MYKTEKNIARARARLVKNPRTSKQVAQRTKWADIQELTGHFAEVITVGFPYLSYGRGRNRFVQCNMKCAQVDDALQVTYDWEHLVCAVGRLTCPKVSASLVESTLTLTPEAQVLKPGFCQGSDRMFAVLVEQDLRDVVLVELGEREGAGEKDLPLTEGWNPAKVAVYCFAVDKDGKKTSGTTWVALNS